MYTFHYTDCSLSLRPVHVPLADLKLGASPLAPLCLVAQVISKASKQLHNSANWDFPPTSWQAAQETHVKFRSWEKRDSKATCY